MQIPEQAKLLFIGDSITDAGRDPSGEPTPWANDAGLGHGYVNLVNALLQTRQSDSRIRILNQGVSGNTIRDLSARWQAHVLDLEPDWLSVKIGINDVWRQFDQPGRVHAHVLPDEFETTYRRLLAQTRPQVEGLVLISPYFIEPNRQDPMRARMDAYGAIVRKLAHEFEGRFVDAQAAMDRLAERMHPTEIAEDRVHPTTVGHMAIATAFLDAVD